MINPDSKTGRILDRLSRIGVAGEAPRTDICVRFGGIPCGQPAEAVVHGHGMCGPHLEEFGEVADDVTRILRDGGGA